MQLRGAAFALTDALHIVWSVVALLCMLIAMGAGAAALGGGFRRYSLATVAVFLVFGTLIFLDAPRLAANLPTPWIGVWERVLMGAVQLWNVALVVALWRGDGTNVEGATPIAMPRGAR